MTDPKQVDLERALRQALRPIEPRAGFEDRVMRALEAPHRPATDRGGLEPLQRRIVSLTERAGRLLWHRPLWALASATAVLALVTAGGVSYREHVLAVRAEETRGQALEALRIANDKLDDAFRLVAETGPRDSAPASGGRSDRDGQVD